MEAEPRVLIVDESISARMNMAAVLRSAGFVVAEAADGVAAARAVLVEHFDAVVTAQSMPGISGLQLCRFLQSDPRSAAIPVVLTSPAPGRELPFWGARVGAAGVVATHALDDLVVLLRNTLAFADARSSFQSTAIPADAVQQRVAALLDRDLSDAILSSEVRKVGQKPRDGTFGSLAAVSASLAGLISQLLAARWFWLATSEHRYIHCADGAEVEARAHLEGVVGGRCGDDISVAMDGRFDGDGIATESHVVSFGDEELGVIGVGASRADGLTRLPLVARELAGPLQVCLLLVRATKLAVTDALTDLPNRRSATDTLQREIEFSRRHGLSVAVLLFDLDHFKQVNDVHGHASGDRALVATARALKSAVRGSDIAARWGGEEFLVIVRNSTEIGAVSAAERVRSATEATRVINDVGDVIPLTVSCGVATLSQSDTLAELVARADRALYLAKANGRNRIVYGPELSQ